MYKQFSLCQISNCPKETGRFNEMHFENISERHCKNKCASVN